MATKRKKSAARGKRYRYKRQSKIDFVRDVKGRLENDIGPYFECIEEIYRQTGRGVGFWALTRMIFPVIEAVATTVFRKSKADIPPVRLLRQLGLRYPKLVWEMYRNVLMHGDELLVATYRGWTVAWSVAIGGGHSSDHGGLQIDLRKLYNDMLQYLDDEANDPQNKGKSVWIKTGFRFTSSASSSAKKEMLAVGRRKRLR